MDIHAKMLWMESILFQTGHVLPSPSASRVDLIALPWSDTNTSKPTKFQHPMGDQNFYPGSIPEILTYFVKIAVIEVHGRPEIQCQCNEWVRT
jgi:hypothetical protein